MTAPAEDLPETTSSKPDRQPAAAENPSGDLSGITELFGLQGDLPEVGTRTEPEGGRAAVAGGVAAQLADATGRLIEGRYRLIAELGVGGMGITYRAWDARARVPVVVKMPNRQARNDAAALIRFAREIAAMEKVPHESIVPITDHGMDEGSPFVVMRFLPGGSLADYRRRDEAGTPLRNPPGMLHFWLPGVAAALDHIHAMGMLHRDVKPGNVFLDGFLKPFLGDFGIAKVVDESGGLAKEHTLTATRMAVGTPEYMAPELFRPRSRLDGRVDQYALAVTVYEMLAGEKPFTGSTAHIIVEHSSLPVPPLEQKVAGLPRSLCDAVHRGLAKDPAERFATCAEFAAAAVADLVPLEPEAETVRLLCPACKNILKLPQRAAGRSGRCPRCHSVMDVAADLGSLWLESEERGESPPVDGPPAQPAPAMPANAEPMPSRRDWAAAWKVWRWGALVAGLVACFAVGRYWSDARLASENRRLSGSLASATTAKQSTALPIDSLTVEQAEKLVATGRPLDLDGLTTLSPEVAAVLGRHQSSLSLNGLDAMTIEAERALAGCGGNLQCGGLTSLASAELAAKLRGKDSYGSFSSFDGNKLRQITPEAAAVLAGSDLEAKNAYQHPRRLNLDHLTGITPGVAAALTSVEDLSLNGLKTLSVDAAAELIRQRQQPPPNTSYYSGTLGLRGLKSLEPGVAWLLAMSLDSLFLEGLDGLSDEDVEALAGHAGGMSLGVKELSDRAAAALADGAGRVVLPSLERASSDSIDRLAERGCLPLNLYSPLGRFLWGLPSRLQRLLLASLFVVVTCLVVSCRMARKLSRATAWTLATRRQASLPTVPLAIAAGMLLGWSVFLGLKWLPRWLWYCDMTGTAVPASFAGLDRLFAGLLLALLAAGVYLAYVRRCVRKVAPPLWGMNRFFPGGLDIRFPPRAASLVAIPAVLTVWMGCVGIIFGPAMVCIAGLQSVRNACREVSHGYYLDAARESLVGVACFGGLVLLGFIVRQAVKRRQRWAGIVAGSEPIVVSMPFFLIGMFWLNVPSHVWLREYFVILNPSALSLGIAIPSLALSLLLFLQLRMSRRSPSFDAYADHFRVGQSQMRPIPLPKVFLAGFGEIVMPWSHVESYAWEPDHLELMVRAPAPLKRIAYRWRICGVVPKDQQQAAHTFLAARFPGKGEPG